MKKTATVESPSGQQKFDWVNYCQIGYDLVETGTRGAVAAAECFLAGRNPSNGWRLPSHCNISELLGPEALEFEYRFLADIPEEKLQEHGLTLEDIDDDDEEFSNCSGLRRQAILAALEEVLFLIRDDALNGLGQGPKNAYLRYSIRMAWRHTLIELLGLWYREQREVHVSRPPFYPV